MDNVVIPEGVKTLNERTFYECSSLASVVLPQSLITIENAYCFYNCSKLSKIILPENLTKIGDNAFQHCTSLKEITIPSNVTHIGSAAFAGCTLLSTLNIPKSVTSIDQYIISGTNIKSVYFEEPNGWYQLPGNEKVAPSILSDPKKAAEELKSTYYSDGARLGFFYARN